MAKITIENPEALKQWVGKEIAASDWLQVTQDRIDRFADATGDHQWIHVDPERAKAESPFGATIAHGYLTLSLLPHMMMETLDVQGGRMSINYGLNRVRFAAPVPSGSRLRAQFRLLAFEPLPGGAQLTVEATIHREGSVKPVCVAELVSRHFV